jgi:predicted anti-sigma-YlaC factor YlaD
MPDSLLFRCSTLYGHLDRYLDGEMSLWDRILVKGHLMMCPKCRVYLRQYAQVWDLSQASIQEELPADFEQVMSSVVARWSQEREPS